MRPGWLAIVVAALVLAATASAPAHAQDPTDPVVARFDATPVPEPISPLQVPSPSTCGQGSWVAGTVDICAGEVVYRDYVYDDFGASQQPGAPPDSGFPFDPSVLPSGDAYGFLPPSGAQQQDAAEADKNMQDIAAVRLHRQGDQIAVTVQLAGLRSDDQTRAVLAVDRDDASATGGGAMPGLLANPDPLSAAPPSADGWDAPLVELDCDAASDACTGAFPAPDGGFRLWALTARRDGTVMNVAFRGTGETGFWWETNQATTLFTGDISAFALDVAPTHLDPATTQRARTPRGVVLQRVYESAHPLGEGVSDDGITGPGDSESGNFSLAPAYNLVGRYQPYGFVLPDQPGPHGAQLTLHGLSENHAGRLYLPGTGDPGLVPNIAEARNRIIVTPTGRGWKNWWAGHGERDAWDALGDVMASYPVDRDALVVSGYSMGGYGTLRLGGLFPDEWAGAINWVGFTGDEFSGTPLAELFGASGEGGFGNALDWVGNLRHVPIASVYGALDVLVPATQAIALRSELARLEVPSIFWLHPTGEHLSPALADDWRKESDWSADTRRVADPITVTFRTDERLFLPDLGLQPDHAYWVQAVDPADAGYADVSARSEGCGGAEPIYEVQSGAGPVDPPPLLASVSQEVLAVGQAAVDPRQRLVLTTTNVASLAIDTGDGASGACLGAGPVEYEITTDRPVTVRLTDGRTLDITQAGTHRGAVDSVADLQAERTAAQPAAVAGAGSDGSHGRSALPRSGEAVPVLVALVLAAIGLVVWRTRSIGSGAVSRGAAADRTRS